MTSLAAWCPLYRDPSDTIARWAFTSSESRSSAGSIGIEDVGRVAGPADELGGEARCEDDDSGIGGRAAPANLDEEAMGVFDDVDGTGRPSDVRTDASIAASSSRLNLGMIALAVGVDASAGEHG